MGIPGPTRQRSPDSVAASLSHLIFPSAQAPAGRVLAVHAGSRTLRLLVAESTSGGRLRILHQHLIDLHQEGLVSAEKTKTHLAEELADWGHPPVAVVLPQHLSISQMIDVTTSSES